MRHSLLPLAVRRTDLNYLDAWASILRMQEFLMAEEHQNTIVTDDRLPHAIEIRGAGFVWEHAVSTSAQVTPYASFSHCQSGLLLTSKL